MNFLRDYPARLRSVALGFRFLGARWLPGAFGYLLHPLLRQFFSGRNVNFGGYRARIGECDLFVLGNLFREYDADFLRRTLPQVDRVIDAGANVGAFSFLIDQLRPGVEIIAIEPDPENFRRLKSQPFAARIDAQNAAIGATAGTCKLVRGENSATHHVEPSPSDAEGTIVPCLALASFSAKPTLLKLDIEGAERELLLAPLPSWIRAVVMEWHYPDESPERFFPPGKLENMRSLGSECWSWTRVD